MAIDEITNAVNFYDDSFQTDNEILNTALMEKSMVCRRYHISFSAIVDGKKLGFMNPMDLYVMLEMHLIMQLKPSAKSRKKKNG